MEEIHSSAKEKGARLKQLRRLARFTQNETAKIAGIQLSTYKSWEAGKYSELPEKRAVFLIPAFKAEGIECTLEWLMHGIGSSPQKIHLFDTHFTPTELVLNETKTEYQKITEELNIFRKNHINTMDMSISDDAMSPLFSKNDVVAGIKLPKKYFSKALGQICIVQTKSGDILLRQIHEGSKPNCYHLLASNTHFRPTIMHDVELICIAPIAFWRRDTSNLMR